MRGIRFIAVVIAALMLTTGLRAQDPPKVGNSVLGAPTRLVLSCKDVISSLTWWTRLGFLPAGAPGRPDSAITLTDGQMVITLTKESLPTPIVMFSSPNIKQLKDSLDALGISTTYDVQGPTYSEVRLVSPNGIHIAVRPQAAEPFLPVSGDSNRLCGKLTELSIGTGFLKRERTFWETLEYTVKRDGREPYPYALMTDGIITIGLHENRDIPTLSMTYFASNMAERLKNIQAAGIEMSDAELTENAKQGSAVLTSPDGQRVMLFQGEQ